MTMLRCQARDLLTVQKREITPQGYLVAPAVIGRCGIQPYLRSELGLDGDPDAVVRLMRLPEEVFRPETVASFENVPITDDHPPAGVDAATWRELSRGHLRDVGRKDGDLLAGTTLVMDGGTVAKVAGGKAQLSCGYSFDLDLTPGTAPDGQPFDGYQRNILGDHLAIVDSPRGGPVCRIGDKKKETSMAMKKLVLDGVPLEMEEVQAAVVENLIKGRDTVVADLAAHRASSKKTFKVKDEQIAEKDKVIAAKDKEIADLTAKLTKAQAVDVDALVTERAQVIGDAKKLVPTLEAKGSSHDIRKAAIVAACADATCKTIVDKMIGDTGIEKATEGQVKGVFEVLLVMPQQATIAAQDAAINRALGAGDSATFTGPVETFDGIPADRKSKSA